MSNSGLNKKSVVDTGLMNIRLRQIRKENNHSSNYNYEIDNTEGDDFIKIFPSDYQ